MPMNLREVRNLASKKGFEWEHRDIVGDEPSFTLIRRKAADAYGFMFVENFPFAMLGSANGEGVAITAEVLEDAATAKSIARICWED